MFDLVQKNRRVAEVVLGIVVLGLVISFGWSGYAATSGENWVAKVGNATITPQQVDEVMRNQPNAQQPTVVEGLVRNQLLLNQAHELRLNPDADQLRKTIAAAPEFQENGQFSPSKYEAWLTSTGMDASRIEKRLTDQLATEHLVSPFTQSGYVSTVTIDRMSQLVNEKREVVTARFDPKDYAAQASVTPAEVKQYYDAHQVDLKAPEMVRVEYVALSAQDIAQQQTVTDAEVQKYFDAHKAQFGTEERKAAHILIQVAAKAPPAERQAAKAKAEALLKQIRANPASFADVAKANSDDGSKAQGGELGWLKQGDVVPPFGAALFSLKKGQISDVVESEFGYHIISLEDIRSPSAEDAKPQIVQAIKAEKSQSSYRASADKFNELVYQQADSLKPAADQLKLDVRQSGWITRQGSQDKLLNSPKLSEALFSDDVLKKKHNTEAIEVAPGTLVSARVVEYKAAQVPPLATATPDIESKLKHDKAMKLAAADGAQKLAALQKGENPALKWSDKPQEVGRIGERDIQPEALKGIFSASATKLPTYVSATDPAQGFVIYKVEKIIPAAPLAPEMRKQFAERLAGAYGNAEVRTYLTNLQKKTKIEIRSPDKAE